MGGSWVGLTSRIVGKARHQTLEMVRHLACLDIGVRSLGVGVNILKTAGRTAGRAGKPIVGLRFPASRYVQDNI